MNKSNVIDLNSRRRAVEKSGKTSKGRASVLDMTARRSEMVSEDRRNVKRTILREFIGVSAVVPQRGLMKLAVHDISDSGISFDVDGKQGCFGVGEEIAMRVYMNRDTYFKFNVKIQNVRVVDDEGIIRHGANFTEGENEIALQHFVKFIETVSASLEKDKGDVVVSNLGGL